MNSLDVIHSETNEQVHDDDRHDQHKEKEKHPCCIGVWNHDDSIVIFLVIKEEIVVLHLPAGHYDCLDQGQPERLKVRLVVEENKKSEGKSHNEENDHDRDFEESIAHINEHHYVDTKEGNFPADISRLA